MKLKELSELAAFMSTYFPDSDLEEDEQTTRAFATASTFERRRQVIDQAGALLNESELPLEELGSEANRWFGDDAEARAWLQKILNALVVSSESFHAMGALTVKDSHGQELHEGDSVQVIKDLKVKGGSSDLKRGTLIKKIHLIGDPEAIECRVDGSTLVLKTCFLKKA